MTAWRRARADDTRRLFPPPPKERPHASIDFVDYVVTDPERLIFTTHALLGPLCDALSAEGAHARRIQLVLPLANGETRRHTLRAARPTAHRPTWLRLARAVLEQLTVPDAVTGVSLHVQATEPAVSLQGDLFDPGFGTAAAVDGAVARLLESQGGVVVRAEPGQHPLAERRHVFTDLTPRPFPGQEGDSMTFSEVRRTRWATNRRSFCPQANGPTVPSSSCRRFHQHADWVSRA